MFALVPIARRIRTSLASLLILAAGSFAAHAQTANTNSYYADIAWTPTYVSGQQILAPVPNAQITVCVYPAASVPCTNLATLYYGPSVGGGVNPTNPTPTDQYGNFSFWAAPGYYQYTVTNSFGQSAGPYTIVLGSAGSGGGTASIPATTLLLKGSNVLGTALAAIPGTAANLSGTPILPNGTSATTQTPGDATTKLSTDAFVAAAITASASASIPATTSLLAGSGVAGVASAVTAIPNGTTATTQSVADNTTKVATDAFVLANASSSQQVVYASKIPGVTTGVAVVPGSSSIGDADSYAPLQAAIAGGNVDLEVDSGFALSAHLALSSNTTIHCTAPQNGFIMLPASNDYVIENAHPTAPTTSSGTGGYLVSNQTDKNIRVSGCQANANSIQAVTGTGSGSSTPHTGNLAGIWMMALQFLGVDGLTIDHNEIYDSGTYEIFMSNDSHIHVEDNNAHAPVPVVAIKNTDGIHLTGPDQYIYETGNKLITGDDAIAINADDGNEVDNPGAYPAVVKWGWITDLFADDNSVDGSYFGLRLYSGTELIDRVSIKNTSGIVCGDGALLIQDTTIGEGNIGKVAIDGWQVQSTGTCNNYNAPYIFYLDINYKALSISNVQVTNPVVNWPVVTQNGGTGGALNLSNFTIDTQTAPISDVVVLSGGTIGNLAASGINWYDNSANTGSVFSGSLVPSVLTCSNYSGPNRLLASGFAPTYQNGDCFTNTYPGVGTVYVNTTFNEYTSGTALATTTPAVCSNGCTGTWTAASGQPSSGVWTYGTNNVSLTGGCSVSYICPVYINAGHADYTIRMNISAYDSAEDLFFILRWTNASNYSDIQYEPGPGQWYVCDTVSGTQTCSAGVTFGVSTGAYTIVANGTTLTMTNPLGSISNTVSSSNVAATNVALLNDYSSTPSSAITVTSFEVSSN